MCKKEIRLGSLFSGSGGFELAGAMHGVTPVWASEIEPLPIAVTKKNFPEMEHVGDISHLDGSRLPAVDIISGGSPCFPAGTFVLTDQGLVEIENVTVGMRVLTHKGRWRQVTAVGSKQGETVVLKGNNFELECTPNHPIYSAKRIKEKPEEGKFLWALSDEKSWTPAEEMKGRLCAMPNHALPTDSFQKDEELRGLFTENFFYLVGLWLAYGRVLDEQDDKGSVAGRIDLIPFRSRYIVREVMDQAIQFYGTGTIDTFFPRKMGQCTFHIEPLFRWLSENFGSSFGEKKIPAWVYSMPEAWRSSLLRGFLDAHFQCGRTIYCSGKRVICGIRILAETLGYTFSIHPQTKETTELDFSKNNHTTYIAELIRSNRQVRFRDDLHTWYPVRSVTPTGEQKTVYNLTVEEDNSYIADGIVVHNCQDMSVAGKREGLDGARSGLFREQIRIVKEMREAYGKPRYMVWENVPGAFSSNKGADFRVVLEEIARIKSPGVSIPEPERKGGRFIWKTAGLIMGDGYSIAWRVHDAQFWGVPQRRRRIFLVADFDGSSAGEILFKSESLPWNLEKSADAWQKAAGSSGSCTEATIRRTTAGGNDIASTLYAAYGTKWNGNAGAYNGDHFVAEPIVPITLHTNNQETSDITHVLRTGGEYCIPIVAIEDEVYSIQGSMVGRAEKNGPQGSGINRNLCFTLNTADRHAVAYKKLCFAIDCRNDRAIMEKSGTLQSKNTGGYSLNYQNPVVVPQASGTLTANVYMVRRLTPLECGRLQGFPDGWTEGLEMEEPDEETIRFWEDVLETHRRLTGTPKKERTRQQVLRWMKSPASDTALYKMWGNGIALPCAAFVMKGIAEKLQKGAGDG